MEIIVDICDEAEDSSYELEFIEKYIKEIIKSEYKPAGSRDIYLSLVFTDNEGIREINREYRGKDEPTDVISFAYHEGEEVDGVFDTLGDIIVSIEKVMEQAKEYEHNFDRELFYVITHGILHLLGYDHMDENEKNEMRLKEEEILSKHNFRRD
jgi:probable rRNA maturation factor